VSPLLSPRYVLHCFSLVFFHCATLPPLSCSPPTLNCPLPLFFFSGLTGPYNETTSRSLQRRRPVARSEYTRRYRSYSAAAEVSPQTKSAQAAPRHRCVEVFVATTRVWDTSLAQAQEGRRLGQGTPGGTAVLRFAHQSLLQYTKRAAVRQHRPVEASERLRDTHGTRHVRVPVV
jgi:hypothetical protein